MSECNAMRWFIQTIRGFDIEKDFLREWFDVTRLCADVFVMLLDECQNVLFSFPSADSKGRKYRDDSISSDDVNSTENPPEQHKSAIISSR